MGIVATEGSLLLETSFGVGEHDCGPNLRDMCYNPE